MEVFHVGRDHGEVTSAVNETLARVIADFLKSAIIIFRSWSRSAANRAGGHLSSVFGDNCGVAQLRNCLWRQVHGRNGHILTLPPVLKPWERGHPARQRGCRDCAAKGGQARAPRRSKRQSGAVSGCARSQCASANPLPCADKRREAFQARPSRWMSSLRDLGEICVTCGRLMASIRVQNWRSKRP